MAGQTGNPPPFAFQIGWWFAIATAGRFLFRATPRSGNQREDGH
jgi:hypothetical protein